MDSFESELGCNLKCIMKIEVKIGVNLLQHETYLPSFFVALHTVEMHRATAER